MGFNKLQHFQKNIDALRIAFKLEQENRKASVGERLLMMQYSGFGGLKFILNPAQNPIDINHWRKTEHELFPLTQELHKLLKENTIDEKQYRSYVDSMRSSVLTAFYTPPTVINAISTSLKETGINFQKILEPSAGIGSFIESFAEKDVAQVTAYEKDLLTGKILKQLYPENTIRVNGFEEIPEREQNSYDIITSNIPFGDTSVFDLSYSRSKDTFKIQAARSIHNYFFLKGTDMLRDGGLLAFITSQGVLNSPNNEIIRNAMMRDNNLVSAIRLPNNLFTDYAGTEVGSDLIILQKNTEKQSLTEAEELFCQSRLTQHNTFDNGLFQDSARIVHTESALKTDPYGKPAFIYLHKDGVEGIAKDLKKMLLEDFSIRLDIALYKGESNTEIIIQTHTAQQPTLSVAEPLTSKPEPPIFSAPVPNSGIEEKKDKQLSIFDLFDDRGEIVTVDVPVKTKKQAVKRNRSVRGNQLELFSSLTQPTYSRTASNTPKNESKPINKQEEVGDLFSTVTENGRVQTTIARSPIPEPAIYSKEIKTFHHTDCLVLDMAGLAISKILKVISIWQCFIPWSYLQYRKQEPKPIFLYGTSTSIYTRKKPSYKRNIMKKGKSSTDYTMPL
jgi:hypothetical protein